jgi:uncharacterized membrane protein
MRSGIETRRRSLAKALSWRIVAAIITTLVVLAMTGRLEFAAKIGLIDTLIKLVIYFVHERTWNKIDYGRLRAPDYEV